MDKIISPVKSKYSSNSKINFTAIPASTSFQISNRNTNPNCSENRRGQKSAHKIKNLLKLFNNSDFYAKKLNKSSDSKRQKKQNKPGINIVQNKYSIGNLNKKSDPNFFAVKKNNNKENGTTARNNTNNNLKKNIECNQKSKDSISLSFDSGNLSYDNSSIVNFNRKKYDKKIIYCKKKAEKVEKVNMKVNVNNRQNNFAYKKPIKLIKNRNDHSNSKVIGYNENCENLGSIYFLNGRPMTPDILKNSFRNTKKNTNLNSIYYNKSFKYSNLLNDNSKNNNISNLTYENINIKKKIKKNYNKNRVKKNKYINKSFDYILPVKSDQIVLGQENDLNMTINLNYNIKIEDLVIIEDKISNLFKLFNERNNNLINTYINNYCFDLWNFLFNNISILTNDKILKDFLGSNKHGLLIIKLSFYYFLFSLIFIYTNSSYNEDINSYNKFLELLKKCNKNFILFCKFASNKIHTRQKYNKYSLILSDMIKKNLQNKYNFYKNEEYLKVVEINNEILFKKITDIFNCQKTRTNQKIQILFNDINTISYKQIHIFFMENFLNSKTISISSLVTFYLKSNPNFQTVEKPYIKSKLNKNNRKKYSLILDLEETLLNNSNNTVTLRPGLFEFLDEVYKFYELILFTSSDRTYSEKLVKAIEKNQKYFSYKFYREHNIIIGNEFVKDLSRIGRELNSVIIVDNFAQNYRLQKENGICIQSFWGYDSINDQCLFKLKNILTKIAMEGNDLRFEIKKYHDEIISNISSNIFKL